MIWQPGLKREKQKGNLSFLYIAYMLVSRQTPHKIRLSCVKDKG